MERNSSLLSLFDDRLAQLIASSNLKASEDKDQEQRMTAEHEKHINDVAEVREIGFFIYYQQQKVDCYFANFQHM